MRISKATTEEIEVFDRAIKKNGETLQKTVAIEESSELQKEICKDLRNGSELVSSNILEEIADVYIMRKQLEIMLQKGIDEKQSWATVSVVKAIQDNIDLKIERLKRRLKKELNNMEAKKMPRGLKRLEKRHEEQAKRKARKTKVIKKVIAICFVIVTIVTWVLTFWSGRTIASTKFDTCSSLWELAEMHCPDDINKWDFIDDVKELNAMSDNTVMLGRLYEYPIYE